MVILYRETKMFKHRLQTFLSLIFFTSCLTVIHAGERVNLLKNPSFSDGFAAWRVWAPADTPQPLKFSTDPAGADGSPCVYLQGFPKSGCVFQSVEPVEYGATYRLVFRFKTEMQTGQATGEIKYQTDKEIKPALWYETDKAHWAKSEPVTGKLDGWKTCEVEIKVPSDTNIKKIVPFIGVTGQSPEDRFFIDAVEFFIVK